MLVYHRCLWNGVSVCVDIEAVFTTLVWLSWKSFGSQDGGRVPRSNYMAFRSAVCEGVGSQDVGQNGWLTKEALYTHNMNKNH